MFFNLSSSSLSAQIPERNNLEVSLNLVNKIYCQENQIGLIFDLTYKNIGDDKLIIFKNPLFGINSSVCKRLPDGATELIFKSHSAVNFGKVDSKNFPNSTEFTELKTGEKFTVKNVVYGTLFYEKKYRIGLKEGKYLLESKVITFTYIIEEHSSLDIKQENLWTQNLSVSVPFDLSFNDFQTAKVFSREQCREYLQNLPR